VPSVLVPRLGSLDVDDGNDNDDEDEIGTALTWTKALSVRLIMLCWCTSRCLPLLLGE
jgi:hypothetical protein